MNISENLKKLRKEKGLSQRKLAVKAKLYYAIICKIEQGRSKDPVASTLVKLADALCVSLDELVGYKALKK
jgi:transcriptional regulator with XRE-family HTH domain